MNLMFILKFSNLWNSLNNIKKMEVEPVLKQQKISYTNYKHQTTKNLIQFALLVSKNLVNQHLLMLFSVINYYLLKVNVVHKYVQY